MLLSVSWSKSRSHNFMTLPPLGLPGHKPYLDSGEQNGVPGLWCLAHQRDLGLILSTVAVDWMALVDSFKILIFQVQRTIQTGTGAHIPVVHLVTMCCLHAGWVMSAVAGGKLHLFLLYQSQWNTEPEVWYGRQLPQGCLPFLLSLRANLTAVPLICNRAFFLVYVLCFWSGIWNM